MINSINIDGYRGLRGNLTNLTKINVFVGANGSGKSRVLELVTASLGKKSDLQGGSELKRITPQLKGYARQLIVGLDPNPPDLNEALSFVGLSQIKTTVKTEPHEEQRGEALISGTRTAPQRTHDGVVIASDFKFSTGPRRIGKLFKEIGDLVSESADQNSTREVLAVCIDEIEHGLHPSVLKRLLLSLLERTQDSPIQLFITTHSPFVISGTRNLGANARIYLLEGGAPIDLFSNSCTPAAEAGFSADQALVAANYLLGAGLDDWFPQKIIVCENSLAVFLQAVAHRFNIACPFFSLHARGDAQSMSRAAATSNLIQSICGAVETKPQQFLFGGNVVVLVDGPLSNGDQVHLEKVNKNRIKPVQIERIGTGDSLEKLYPKSACDEYVTTQRWTPWDRTNSFEEYVIESLGTNQNGYAGIGTYKAALADFVAKKAEEGELEFAKEFLSELAKNA